MIDYDSLKKQAALNAVEFVQSGMVLGLGTGSTTLFAIQEIGNRLKTGALQKIIGIPSSQNTEKHAQKYGVPLTTFAENHHLDLTIDGADEVDNELNMIKGGGGALLREKVLAQNSSRLIIIVDESKMSTQIGSLWPVPVEVIPFARYPIEAYLRSLGAKTKIRKNKNNDIYLTDQKNIIIDCWFGPIFYPQDLAKKLKAKAGIVEHGLFLGLATDIIVAGLKGIHHIET